MSPLLTSFAGASARGYGFGAGSSPATFELISTTLIASTTTSVNITAIPSTYTHLQLRVVGRSAYTGTFGQVDLTIGINNDASANPYSYHVYRGDGTSFYVAQSQSNSVASVGVLATSWTSVGSNIFAATIIDILDYTNTNKHKTMRGFTGFHSPASAANNGKAIALYSASDNAITTAISSLQISDGGSGGFVAGTRISLYGIKGA